MTIAYGCVVLAIVLPLVWAGYAKRGYFKTGGYDNSAPRLQLAKLEGASQRANWAQQNAFEALPGFAAAVIIAHQAGGHQGWIDALALVFVFSRVAHGICYIRDLPTARSLVWALGFAAVVGQFAVAFAAG